MAVVDRRWDRVEEVGRVRDRIWRHISGSARFLDEVQPEAAALLQLDELDLRHLARLHFVLGDEVEELLESLPRLTRRLATTTVAEEEWSTERVRGTIEWGRTIGARAATGLPHLYVTAPARRAYQTPENELLAFVLDAISQTGRDTRLSGSKSGVGKEIGDRVDVTESWRRRRAISSIQRRAPTPRSVGRIRTGRHRVRYGHALRAYQRYQSLCVELDRAELRRVVEERALATIEDSTLFEIITTLDVVEALERLGWKPSRLRLFGAPRALRVTGRRGLWRLTLWYQHTPPALAARSRYAHILAAHGISPDWVRRRPDLVLNLRHADEAERWILLEAKLGTRRSTRESARAALADLLSYRRDFSAALDLSSEPYGLGVAWGAGLDPSCDHEVLLVTPDHIEDALTSLLP